MFKKIKRKSIEVLRNFFLFRIGVILRTLKKKPLPSKGPVLIHIGCGEFNDSRYINIDTRPGWHIDYVETIENLEKRFPKDYADLIYGCHVLEHVSHLKLSKTLRGLHKCLKKGGILRLSVPNFEVIVKMYQQGDSVNDIIAPLMGGQGYSGNFHYSVFNKKYLRDLLLRAGFREVRKWDPEKVNYHNFNDWSRKKINLYNRDWPISLNFEAVK